MTGRLHDISMGGLAIEFATFNDAPPQGVDDLQACFRLADESADATIDVRVQHRSEAGDKMNTGVSLLLEGHKDAEAIQDIVIEYVMARQREIRQQQT